MPAPTAPPHNTATKPAPPETGLAADFSLLARKLGDAAVIIGKEKPKRARQLQAYAAIVNVLKWSLLETYEP